MLVGSAVRRVAIVGGVRIPFARAHGAYANVGNQEMLTAAFRGVVERYKLQGVRLGDAMAGAVIKHSKDYNLARECVIGAGLDPQTPGVDVQRACGTSLEAAIDIAFRGSSKSIREINGRTGHGATFLTYAATPVAFQALSGADAPFCCP